MIQSETQKPESIERKISSKKMGRNPFLNKTQAPKKKHTSSFASDSIQAPRQNLKLDTKQRTTAQQFLLGVFWTFEGKFYDSALRLLRKSFTRREMNFS